MPGSEDKGPVYYRGFERNKKPATDRLLRDVEEIATRLQHLQTYLASNVDASLSDRSQATSSADFRSLASLAVCDLIALFLDDGENGWIVLHEARDPPLLALVLELASQPEMGFVELGVVEERKERDRKVRAGELLRRWVHDHGISEADLSIDGSNPSEGEPVGATRLEEASPGPPILPSLGPGPAQGLDTSGDRRDGDAEGSGTSTDEKAFSGNDLDHSRQLDVHTWSDHPEVNAFVNEIYDTHFKGGKTSIRKKHLKVLLLDLYVAWCDDPTLKIAMSRNVDDYKAGSRYNALHLSKLTIKIADQLAEAGLIAQVAGFFDRRPAGNSRVSRIWPTDALIQRFKAARFGILDVGMPPDRETIILRNEAGADIEYDDTQETERMRAVLEDYNTLLRRTFIDIPTLRETYIDLSDQKSRKPSRLFINQKDKFVRRIFNRGSFQKCGRFFGGWWQRCPKEWRSPIFIDDNATSEIDYSGLHIVMLYARHGIDYWKDIGNDPYLIEIPDFLETEEQSRNLAKRLLLIALNARNETSTFAAFRNDADTGSSEKQLTNRQLSSVLNQLKKKHPIISVDIASDIGIDLMNYYSAITEFVIDVFTNKQIPILAIYDSYIVALDREDILEESMTDAFEKAMGVAGVKLKEETERPATIIRRWDDRRAFDRRNPAVQTLFAAEYAARTDPYRSPRYKAAWDAFQKAVALESRG